jgi:hypothetical protein
MDGATDLSELLGGQPVQSPAFTPMVTGGGDPFISPINTSPPKVPSPDYSRQFSILRYSLRSLLEYFAFFLAAAIMSLSTPRTLVLQYIPATMYTSGGVVSYAGAAVLGGATVVGAFVIKTVFNALF